MDTDLVLVIGIIVLALSLPALLSAFSESRPPRTAAIMLMIGGVLVVVALSRHGIDSYSFADIPNVFARVIARYLR
jgi:formate-dependent nitrite reductase membrane component NrfD